MNDSMSILLATTVLALGGLGLYMYKSSEGKDNDAEESEYNEDGLFSSTNLFGWSSNEEGLDEDKSDDIKDDVSLEEVKPRRRNSQNANANSKTQRSRKTSSNSRRKYY